MASTSVAAQSGGIVVSVPVYEVVRIEPVAARIIGGGTSSVIPGAAVGVSIPEAAFVVTAQEVGTSA